MIVGLPRLAQGLRAYDCFHPEAAVTTLDLHGPGACPAPDQLYHAPEPRQVQIIQQTHARPVTVSQCLI